MHLTKRPDGWWIVDDVGDVEDCGPYATKADAEADKRGMERFLKYGDQPGFITAARKAQP